MIKVDQDSRQLINDIDYRHKANQTPVLDDVYTLFGLIDTRETSLDTNLSKHLGYWEFLHEILNSITSDRLTFIPGLYTISAASKEQYWLAPKGIEAEHKKYLQHREQVIKSLGLQLISNDVEIRLKYNWLTRPNGFFTMLESAKAIISLYGFYN